MVPALPQSRKVRYIQDHLLANVTFSLWATCIGTGALGEMACQRARVAEWLECDCLGVEKLTAQCRAFRCVRLNTPHCYL